jgi:hypothetical protein
MDIYNTLLRERRDNDLTIEKLTARNKAITEAIRPLEKLIGASRPRKTIMNEIAAKIVEVMSDGRVRNITKIGTRVLGHVPHGNEPKMIANYCRGLVNRGELRRLIRGQYQATKPAKTTTTVGADTKVTRVYPKEQTQTISEAISEAGSNV